MGGRISSISGFSLTELTVTIAITSMMLSMAFGLPTYMGQHVSHMEGQMEHSELQLTLLNALSQKRSCTRLFSNVELDPEETASVPLNLQLPGFGSLTTGSHYGMLEITSLKTTGLKKLSETSAVTAVSVKFEVKAKSRKSQLRPFKTIDFYKGLVVNNSTHLIEDCLDDGQINDGEICTDPSCAEESAELGPVKNIFNTGYCKSDDGLREYFLRSVTMEGDPLHNLNGHFRIVFRNARDPNIIACDSGWYQDYTNRKTFCGDFKAKIDPSTLAASYTPLGQVSTSDCQIEVELGNEMPWTQMILSSISMPMHQKTGTQASSNCVLSDHAGVSPTFDFYVEDLASCIAFCKHKRVYDGRVDVCTYNGTRISIPGGAWIQ